MFLPGVFENQQQDQLLELIRENPFATLVVECEQGIELDQLPLLLVVRAETLTLQGHFARANPLVLKLSTCVTKRCSLVFNGANSYISPNFYPSKKIDGKAVPTWNYSAVHVNGQITLHDNEQWCRDFLERFTSEHEGDADDSWRIDDAPKHYIDRMLKAIVGVEIVVDTMIGKYKLSQNQSLKNVSGVVKGLGQRAEEGDEAMAELVATYNAERIGE